MTDVAAHHDELRPLMFSIAYRMLGSVAEAKTSPRRPSCGCTGAPPSRDRGVLGLVHQARTHRLAIEPVPVNGQPGARVRVEQGHILSVFALDIAGDYVRAIHNVLNPDKLRHVS